MSNKNDDSDGFLFIYPDHNETDHNETDHNKPDKLQLLTNAVLGFIAGAVLGAIVIAGAVLGAIVAVVLAAVWFFGIRPLYHRVNMDSPGLGIFPLLFAPFGAIVGGALGTVWGMRWR